MKNKKDPTRVAMGTELILHVIWIALFLRVLLTESTLCNGKIVKIFWLKLLSILSKVLELELQQHSLDDVCGYLRWKNTIRLRGNLYHGNNWKGSNNRVLNNQRNKIVN